jgi:hypothetical protein
MFPSITYLTTKNGRKNAWYTVSTVLISDLVYFMLFFFQNSIRGLFIASVSSPSENFEESQQHKWSELIKTGINGIKNMPESCRVN